jgi:two-component system response regulator (stage 0 sporulation protein A)
MKDKKGVMEESMMDAVKVLVVDDNTELLRALVDFLNEKERISVVGQATNGAEALQMIVQYKPDVLVTDIIMPRMDGFTLMENLGQMELEKRPEIVALTALGRDDFIMRAISLGARYYMVKPFDATALYRCIMDAAQAGGGVPLFQDMPAAPAVRTGSAQSVDERIATVFLAVGIPAHIKGYQFLREAVKMVMDEPEMINRITKELYPGIARKFSTTSSKVERAIRHAIEVAWSRGRIDALDQIFGAGVCSLSDKPTNGEFIALVADKLSLERSA